MALKVLLVKPNTPSDTVIPPVGLGFLAQAVSSMADVEIIDCLRDNISINRLLDYIIEKTPDIVGIQAYNIDKDIVSKYLHGIKRINCKVITVIGGPFPSCEPQNVYDFFRDSLDFAIKGEAEQSFKMLLKSLSGGNIKLTEIPGLIWIKDGKICENKSEFPGFFVKYPRWDLLHPHKYPEKPLGAFLNKYPAAPINISRGCPYCCSFCAGWKVTGRRVRYRDIRNVLEEILLLYNKYKVREFHILDDNFTYSKDYVVEFCKALIGEKIDAKFSCPNGMRIDTLDEEVFVLMKRAGFYAAHIGIESGSQRVLNYMGKSFNTELLREKIKIIKTVGFDVCGYFILGYPGETAKDLRATIHLARELPLDRAMFMNFLPIPGTKIYNDLKENEKCSPIYSQGNFYRVNIKGLSLARLRQKYFQIKAFAFFYLRPKIFFKNLKDIYNFKQMSFIMKRIFRILTNV